MPKIRFTFGLDFGTSKTAISFAQSEALNPQVVDIAILGDEDRIPTCVLHDTSRNRFYVGGVAEQEYLLVQDPEVRSVMAFYSNFKPHIHQSGQHRTMALRFLAEVRKAERLSERFQFAGDEAVVVAGCPVSWMNVGGAETLRALLREAGFPPAFAIPEPVGAAFHFLGSQLRAQDFHRDIVVFDWGAGTFDMTVLRAGRMDLEGSKTWGSTVYGGRLFDDLFYQWLIDMAAARGRNDELKKLADHPIDRAVLLGLTCRKVKEGFSRHYSSQSSDRPWTWATPLVLGTGPDGINLGNFFVQNVAEFEERMRSYRASEAVRQWLDLSSKEIEPEEAAFINALQKGDPVDLEAWGNRLVATGLKKLEVGDGATAVLTGGSCNWRWFLEHVRSIAPFAGRATAVLRDDRPELTIARGLSRAYAVGSYSKRLITEVRDKRELLIPQLQRIHGELLEKLSFQLTALAKDDDKLRADLRAILKDGLIRADARPPGGFIEWLRSLFNLALKDPAAEAIRPDIERLIERWLTDNRQRVERWAQRFSIEANARIMELLRQHINAEISGLVEVAMEACAAAGQTPFDEALRALGGKVRFEPNMVARVYKEVGRAVREAYGKYVAKNDQTSQPTSVDERAAALTVRFFEAMPAAIRWNILTVQPPDRWAQRVNDHLIETLETLIRVARVDQAERLILEAA